MEKINLGLWVLVLLHLDSLWKVLFSFFLLDVMWTEEEVVVEEEEAAEELTMEADALD